MIGTMRLTNDCYLVRMQVGNGVEYYYRDADGWVKQSTRGRKFRATAEQVLNHLLPALAGVKDRVSVDVTHRDFDEHAGAQLDHLREGL
jgi:hypothetical protein